MLVHPTLSLEDEIDALGAAGGKRRRDDPELQAQTAVVKYLRIALPRGSIVARVVNEAPPPARLSQRQRVGWYEKRRRTGVLAGFPDLLCLIPVGRTLLIEMKDQHGKPDERQAELHRHLRSIGHPTFVCRCVLSAAEAVRSAGFTPRRSDLDP